MSQEKNYFRKDRKQIALLIDPDKTQGRQLEEIAFSAQQSQVDVILVGGSLLVNGNLVSCVQYLKNLCDIPIVLFPGNSIQVTAEADAILFLSLISGRNPEFLIGHHVLAAPLIKRSGMRSIPTGYMLVGAEGTSVHYMSGTIPIPYTKPDIAVATALAGEMLGHKVIYMDAGSGANQPISLEMIEAVSDAISLPLVIGGGIRNAEQAQQIYQSGADCVVVGTIIEKHPEILTEISDVKHIFNQNMIQG